MFQMQNRKYCYCAFCKNTRKVYSSKHMSLSGIVGMVVLSYVMTYVIWHQPDQRGLIILGTFLMIAEGATQLRWRQSLVCQHCGFDPIVYMKSPELAGVKIKEFMKVRSERPEFLLKPVLNLQPRRASPTTGENLSLHG